MTSEKERGDMDPAEMLLPVLSIAAAAAITFYAVSFNELREKSLEKLESSDAEKPETVSSSTDKEKYSKKKAIKLQKQRDL